MSNFEDLRVLILAGGRGTRSEDPSLPKILQTVGAGYDIARLHSENIARSSFTKVSLLLKFGANEVLNRFQSLARGTGIRIDHFIDSFDEGGTTAAVLSTQGRVDENDLLIILGDIASSIPYDNYYSKWKKSGKALGVLVHPNLHPFDSDIFYVDQNARAATFRKKNSSEQTKNWPSKAVAGVFFLTKDLLQKVDSANSDLTTALVEAAEKNIQVMVTSHYLKDSGTKDRIQAIRDDMSSGALHRRGSRRRRAIFLDRDGTLIHDAGTGRKKIHECELDSSINIAIANANKKGIPIFVVTNQPGIAKSEIKEDDVLSCQSDIENCALQHFAVIDDFRFCPHHPDGGFKGEVTTLKKNCECRKPKIGMFIDLAGAHDIDLSNSFVLGDSENDRGAATKMGANFLLCQLERDSHGHTSKNIDYAVWKIVNDNFENAV